MSAVLFDALLQGVEIECLQSAFRFRLEPLMCHEQLPVHQVYISLDAAETVVERIEQRALVDIIVVRVNAGERRGSGLSVQRRSAKESGRVKIEARKHRLQVTGCKLQVVHLLACHLQPSTCNLQRFIPTLVDSYIFGK